MDINVFVEKVIVHILDTSVGIPVLSDKLHPMNIEISDYLQNHISRILSDDDLKEVFFKDGEENHIKSLLLNLSDNSNDFINTTREIANQAYEIMLKYTEIPSADVVFLAFKIEDIKYLGFIKFNYKESYIHHVIQEENATQNSIIKQRTTLPNENQRIEECFLINLNDLSIKIKEKKYDLEGEKDFYLSKILLNSTYSISNKQKLNIIDKAAKKIIKHYYDEDYSKILDVKKAMKESFEEKERIDVEDISQKAFQNHEIREEYIKEVEEQGLKEKEMEISENLQKKIYKKQRIVTDSGIEIKIPVDFLKSNDKVEFVNNVNGTISILIKNIDKIMNK